MYIHKLLAYSAAVWILPASIALYFDSPWFALPAVLVGFLSYKFHTTGNDLWENLDTGVSVAYIAIGPVMMLKVSPAAPEWIIVLSGVALCALLYWLSKLYARRYVSGAYLFWHTLWHLGTGVTASLVYLIYFLTPR